MSVFPNPGHSCQEDIALHSMSNNLGTKLGFNESQCVDIQHWLIRGQRWRDLALFMSGVDTHLRSVDLLRLRYEDIIDIHGRVKSTIIWGQKKNKRTVECALSPPTREALRFWVLISGKQKGDFLFTRVCSREDLLDGSPVCRKTLARLVKLCAEMIGLDPVRYSTKSLRVSRIPAILTAAEKDYVVVQDVLGHADIRSTVHYCLRAVNLSLKISQSIQFFEPMSLPTTDFRTKNSADKFDETPKIGRE